MPICTSCGKGTLEPILRPRPIMIIKEAPTQNEIEHEHLFCFSGKNHYGYVENTTSYYLQKELGAIGLQMSSFNLTSLFLHIPPKRRRTKEEKQIIQGCVDYSVSEAIKAMQDMKVILMMGAEIVKMFIGHGVSDVSGLVCKSELLPNVPIIIPSPNPDKMMQQPIGELRHALKVFAEQIEIYNQYKDI